MSDLQIAPVHSYRCRVFGTGDEFFGTETFTARNPDEVWHEASMSACELIRNAYGRMAPGFDWRMEVLDPAGKLIYQFSFKAEAF
jgi:hypothetical protein